MKIIKNINLYLKKRKIPFLFLIMPILFLIGFIFALNGFKDIGLIIIFIGAFSGFLQLNIDMYRCRKQQEYDRDINQKPCKKE